MATSQTLQAAVHKATTPNWDASPEEQEGDPIAMVEISEAIANNPKLTADLVKFIKARIKDQNTQVTFIALDVMDQCMESCGFTFQALVQKKALERIGKISAGAKGIPEMVRSKAATCITKWGDLYGADPRLEGFKKAALMVQSRDVKNVREAFSEELKEAAEMREAARVAEEADAVEVKERMKEMGVEPKEGEAGAATTPAAKKRGFFSWGSKKVDKKKAAEAAAAMKKQEQEARNQMTYVILMERAKEASETLGAILEGSTGEELQENEAAHEVVVTCMKYQTHLEVLASSVQEDEKVSACIAMNEELTERITLYEQFVTGQAQPGELLSVPIPKIGGGAGQIKMSPMVEESTSTLSDASAIFKGQVTTAGLPPPDYSESDDDDDGGDLINFGDTSTEGAAGGGDSGNLYFGGGAAGGGGAANFNFSKDPPKVDELYKAADAVGGGAAGGGDSANPFDAPAAAGGGGDVAPVAVDGGDGAQMMSPMSLDSGAFEAKFDACGGSLGDMVNASSRWTSPDDVKKLVETGLCMALVPVADSSTVVGAATYPGSGGPVECFVKLEGVSEGTYLMDIRSTDETLRNAVEKVVKGMLES